MLRRTFCAEQAAAAAAAASAATPLTSLPQTPYAALGLDMPTATKRYSVREIHAAYRRTALLVHPDVRGGDQRLFVLAQRAAKILEADPNDVTSWRNTSDFPFAPPAAAPREQPSPRSAHYAPPRQSPYSENHHQHGRQASWARRAAESEDPTAARRGTAEPHGFAADAEKTGRPATDAAGGGYRAHDHNRHFVSEVAAHYYAWRTGEYQAFLAYERARREHVRIHRQMLRQQMARYGAAADLDASDHTISSVVDPIFFGRMLILNALLFQFFITAAIAVWFYCEFQIWMLHL